MQSATFADAPAEARRLIRRKVRGTDAAALDGVQFGCMISGTATLHPQGGAWMLSRALDEALSSLEAIEAKKTAAGKAFGELVRERRRQFGLPLPVADKVLPFRPTATSGETSDYPSPVGSGGVVETADPLQHRVILAEGRVAEAFAALQAAELQGAPRRTLDHLEQDYHAEAAAYRAIVLQPPA